MDLSKIVGGKVTKRFLEAFLSGDPESYGIFDLMRCDKFIISLYRYKPRFYEAELQKHLRELKWEEENIQWFISRIFTGLQILETNNLFNRNVAPPNEDRIPQKPIG